VGFAEISWMPQPPLLKRRGMAPTLEHSSDFFHSSLARV
jgi:hypothetical protein